MDHHRSQVDRRFSLARISDCPSGRRACIHGRRSPLGADANQQVGDVPNIPTFGLAGADTGICNGENPDPVLERVRRRPHTADMTGTLIVMLIVAAAVLGWSATRAAADAARRHGHIACERAGVQLLDQTVALTRISLRRDRNGRLRLLSQYSFDYSPDRVSRMRGGMALLGSELQWITDPKPQAPQEPALPG
jgi:hypothetical protein